MDLRHLRYFVAVAQELHFGRAAQRLGMAQPPLSQRVRELEAELGVRLFGRTRPRVELSHAGRVFLEQARATLARAEEAVRSARQAANVEAGRFSIGLSPWVEYTHVPHVVQAFGTRYRNIDVELHTLSATAQIQALQEHRIDVGFLPSADCGPTIEIRSRIRDSVIAVLPEMHRLARRRRLRLADLVDGPLIVLARHAAPEHGELIRRLFGRNGVSPRLRYEADHPQTIMSLVAAGVGLSLVPGSLLNAGLSHVVYRRLPPSSERFDLVTACRRGEGSPVLKAFLEIERTMRPRRSNSRDAGRSQRPGPHIAVVSASAST